nr:unnamed protein product [Callosobruchus chinensis]
MSGTNKPQPSLGTEPIRGSITSLFLTIKKPHKKAATQTLGRWVKSVLVEIHAARSVAARKVLHFDTIRLASGCSKISKMFAAVYNRPLVFESKSFTETIFSL